MIFEEKEEKKLIRFICTVYIVGSGGWWVRVILNHQKIKKKSSLDISFQTLFFSLHD